MKKILVIVSITAALACVSIAAHSCQELTKPIISDINDEIEDATNACDFEQLTKRYFEGTKFYSYEMVNGAESVVEQSYSEVIPAIRQVMTDCSITLEQEQTISENITISSSGQKADFVFEAIQSLRDTDGQLFESHNKGRIVYGFKQGKIVILESHYKVLSYKQLDE